MRLIIGTAEYPLANINDASLEDLMQLKQMTGIGMKTLRVRLEGLSQFADPEDVLDDAESLIALGALVWLTRKRAGEKLSFEDACKFPLSELSFAADPEDGLADEGDVDPKSAPGSDTDSTTT